MKVLVTGGTGFVGSHLIEQLVASGDTVRAIVRPNSNRAFLESLGAEPVVGDIEDEESLAKACEGCEVVYHSAARVDLAGTEDDFRRTTVEGTQHVVRAAAGQGVRRLVQLSSCGVYPPAILASGQVIDETTPVPLPPKWFTYGRAKYYAEQAVQHESPADLEWVILRLGYLYGPRNRTMHSHIVPALQSSIMMIIGDGSNELAMVYVEDAVRAVVQAGRTPAAAGQIFIVGGNERITQKEYFDTLADGFGLPRIKKHVPYRIAYFACWLGEYLVRRGPEWCVMKRAAVALTGLPQRLSSKRTQELLDWAPDTRFEEGMRKAFDWYHAEYGPVEKKVSN